MCPCHGVFTDQFIFRTVDNLNKRCKFQAKIFKPKEITEGYILKNVLENTNFIVRMRLNYCQEPITPAILAMKLQLQMQTRIDKINKR